MKIIFIGGRDIRMLGGIENYMYNLATQLVKLGHTPIVYCESDHDRKETINGFEVRFVKGPKSNLLCKPWVGLKATLRTVFKEKGVDFIHYNAWPPSLWCWIPRLAGIPSLMEGHGLEWQRSKYSHLARWVMKLMERFTAHLNQNLVMCSEDQVRYFKDTYGKDSVCIPGAVNIPSQDAGKSSCILDKYGLSPKKYFLFMGRLVQDKNPDYLIRAFLKSGIEGYKLVIAGNNDAMPEYVQYLHNITDRQDVIFTGAMYGEDKAALLSNAYAFCLPSSIEGLSIVLMEAMSYRIPVLASDIQANRELLGENALFFPPEDETALADVLCRALVCSDSEDFASKNYNTIESEYTWEGIALKYLVYIESKITSSKSK